MLPPTPSQTAEIAPPLQSFDLSFDHGTLWNDVENGLGVGSHNFDFWGADGAIRPRSSA